METLTIAEAAQATGLTRKAIRNRVDRGQLRAVLRDGTRRIPRSEIERAGLPLDGRGEAGNEAAEEAAMRQRPHEAAPGQPHDRDAWAEVLERLERQAGELAELRALTREAESLRDERERFESAYNQERAEKQAAEQRLEQLGRVSWRERRRLLRELRRPAA